MSRRRAKRNILTQRAKEKDNSIQTKVLSSHPRVFVLLIGLFLVVATLAAFWQVRNHEFINFDDNAYVTDNQHVQSGLTLEGLTWAFTTTLAGNWHPLTWLTHMLDCQLYGLNPSGHHLTNLVFHIASTLLLFLVLERMTGALWRSGFVAALFALHPLRVESVAWVAERKDVLSVFFWMLTMWAYIRYVERPKLQRYLLALLFFALGLMSKPMLVTMPFALLLFDYWPLGRFQFGQPTGDLKSRAFKSMNPSGQKSIAFRLVREKAPFFALCAVSIVLTIFAQGSGEAIGSLEDYRLDMRVANALVSYISYIGKMICPRHLSVFYPYQEMLPLWKIVGSGLPLICLSILVIRVARKYPCLAVGWFWYLGTLIPVIGLVQVGMQAMADRYTYVPLIGLFVMMIWSVPDTLAGWHYRRVALSLLAGILLSILMIVTRVQVQYWQNSITLFEHSIGVTSNNSLAHNNLGAAFMYQGKIQEAIDHFAEVLRISPNQPGVHNNLGVLLQRQGRIQEATAHFAEALRIKPDNVEAHNNLGAILAKQGRTQEAIAHFAEALRIKPDYSEAHYSLGLTFAEQGRTQEAIAHFAEALRIKPNNGEAHNNLGVILAKQGRTQEAIAHFAESLRIKPDNAEAHNNLGVTLLGHGKIQEAIAHFTKAVQAKPDYVEAHINLGFGYLTIGDKVSALEEYKILKKLSPNLADQLYQRISK